MRRLLGTALVLGSALASGTASATDVQACLAASEKGQQARSDGRLREARERFLVCAGDGCPAIVRRDCSQWQAELVAMMPSIVFGAKDKQGRDLFDVTVTMDGEPLVKKLDGKSIPIDPGPHTFRFESAGQPAVTERALVKEGEKSRGITVTFGGGGASPPTTATSTDAGPERDGGDPSTTRGHTVLPWVVFGVGVATVVAGVVVVLTAPDLPTNCVQATSKCTRAPGETDAQFAEAQAQAGQHDARPFVGLVVGAVGLAVAGGGLLWHFLEPTREDKRALRITPWAGPGSSGLVVGRSF
jgi:hypothetical protein